MWAKIIVLAYCGCRRFKIPLTIINVVISSLSFISFINGLLYIVYVMGTTAWVWSI